MILVISDQITHVIERFSIECRETKTKEITTANPTQERKYHQESKRTPGENKQTAWSAGKREWRSRDWFQF